MADLSLEGMQYQDDWQRFLQHLQSRGLAIDPTQSGGYAPRNIAGTNTPSQHAFGRAMDINYNVNPEGASTNAMPAFDVAYGPDAPIRAPTMQITPDIAREASQLFNMRWGGDFRNRSPDPMHFELSRRVPQAPLGGPLVASVGGPTPPTSDTAPAPNLPGVPARPGIAPPIEDRSIAARMFGPELAGGIRGVINNPAFLKGVSILTGMPHVAETDFKAEANARADEELAMRRVPFQQQQQQYALRQKIWGEVYPGGVPNMNHPLLKGMSPQAAGALYGLGAEQALPLLGTYVMGDAKAKADLERKLGAATQIDQMFAPGQQPGPAPIAPLGPQMPGPSATPPAPLPGAGGVSPQPAPLGVPRPAAAAPAPSVPGPAAALPPAGVPAQPTVMGMPIDVARRKAQMMDRVGMRDEVLEAAIKAAEKEGSPTEASKTSATKVDQAYRSLSTALDDYKKLVQRTGAVTLGKDADAVNASRRNIQLQLKDLYDLGVLNGPDLMLMDSMLPDPQFHAWSNPFAGLASHEERVGPAVDRIKENLRTLRNAKVGVLGLP